MSEDCGCWGPRQERLPSVVSHPPRSTSAADVLALISTMVEGEPSAVVVADQTGQIVIGNPVVSALLGYSQEELAGRPLVSLLPERYRSRHEAGFAAFVARTHRGDRSLVGELHALRPDGVEVPVAVHVSQVETSAGTYVVGRMQDLRAERALQTTSERLAALVSSTDDAVTAADSDGIFTDWNPAAERLYGRCASDMIGQRFAVLAASPEDAAAQEHAVESARQGLAVPLDGSRLRPDGTVLDIEGILAPLYLRDGSVGGFSMISRDVTERNRHAAERALADEHLIESAHFLQELTDSMGEGMFALDADGLLAYINPVAATIFGYEPAELLGQIMHDRTHYRRPDGSAYPRDECPMLVPRAAGTRIAVDRDLFYRNDGSSFAVSYTASGLPKGGGGCVVVFRDISEAVVAEDRLRRELDSLSWVGRLQSALDNDQLVLYAQPIARLSDGVVTQHELLLRMCVGDEIILPGAFLPAAEEFGLIGRVDRWVVEQAARLAADGYHVEFNLSARSVADPSMIGFVASTIAAAGAPPERLVCEITETALISDEAQAERFVNALADLGCGVSLDDFGVGYGGFSYLKRLKVSHLKIDMQFVRDILDEPSSRHVVSAVVSLARAFHVVTIAEGAETLEAVALLRELGVDYVQGYAIGHPLPLDVGLTLPLEGGPDDRSDQP